MNKINSYRHLYTWTSKCILSTHNAPRTASQLASQLARRLAIIQPGSQQISQLAIVQPDSQLAIPAAKQLLSQLARRLAIIYLSSQLASQLASSLFVVVCTVERVSPLAVPPPGGKGLGFVRLTGLTASRVQGLGFRVYSRV